MRILFTNNTLLERAGTELFVRDLALALVRLGHEVAAYSMVLGEVAVELEKGNVIVTDRLASLPWSPDVIHGHHHLELMTALLFFRNTPAVFVSHGWIPWVEIPPRHPRIIEYFAVDNPTREAATREHHIPAELVRILPNFVDLDRFQVRPPLPAKPRRALVLSNYAREETYLQILREACAQAGLELDVLGMGVDRIVRDPEHILPQYDVVFAKGRTALEAVAVGNAVIVCDTFGAGPMVNMSNALALQSLAGDYHTLYEPLSVEALTRELANYQPSQAAAVCQLARAMIGLDKAVSVLLASYERAIAKFSTQPVDEKADAVAESDYLFWVARYIKDNPEAVWRHDALAAELESARAENVRLAKALALARKPAVKRIAESFSRFLKLKHNPG